MAGFFDTIKDSVSGFLGGGESTPAVKKPQSYTITDPKTAANYLKSTVAPKLEERGDKEDADALRVLASDEAFMDEAVDNKLLVVNEYETLGTGSIDLEKLAEQAALRAKDEEKPASDEFKEAADRLEESFVGRDEVGVNGVSVTPLEEQSKPEKGLGTTLGMLPLAVLAFTGLSIPGLLIAGILMMVAYALNLGDKLAGVISPGTVSVQPNPNASTDPSVVKGVEPVRGEGRGAEPARGEARGVDGNAAEAPAAAADMQAGNDSGVKWGRVSSDLEEINQAGLEDDVKFKNLQAPKDDIDSMENVAFQSVDSHIYKQADKVSFAYVHHKDEHGHYLTMGGIHEESDGTKIFSAMKTMYVNEDGSLLTDKIPKFHNQLSKDMSTGVYPGFVVDAQGGVSQEQLNWLTNQEQNSRFPASPTPEYPDIQWGKLSSNYDDIVIRDSNSPEIIDRINRYTQNSFPGSEIIFQNAGSDTYTVSQQDSIGYVYHKDESGHYLTIGAIHSTDGKKGFVALQSIPVDEHGIIQAHKTDDMLSFTRNRDASAGGRNSKYIKPNIPINNGTVDADLLATLNDRAKYDASFPANATPGVAWGKVSTDFDHIRENEATPEDISNYIFDIRMDSTYSEEFAFQEAGSDRYSFMKQTPENRTLFKFGYVYHENDSGRYLTFGAVHNQGKDGEGFTAFSSVPVDKDGNILAKDKNDIINLANDFKNPSRVDDTYIPIRNGINPHLPIRNGAIDAELLSIVGNQAKKEELFPSNPERQMKWGAVFNDAIQFDESNLSDEIKDAFVKNSPDVYTNNKMRVQKPGDDSYAEENESVINVKSYVYHQHENQNYITYGSIYKENGTSYFVPSASLPVDDEGRITAQSANEMIDHSQKAQDGSRFHLAVPFVDGKVDQDMLKSLNDKKTKDNYFPEVSGKDDTQNQQASTAMMSGKDFTKAVDDLVAQGEYTEPKEADQLDADEITVPAMGIAARQLNKDDGLSYS